MNAIVIDHNTYKEGIGTGVVSDNIKGIDGIVRYVNFQSPATYFLSVPVRHGETNAIGLHYGYCEVNHALAPNCFPVLPKIKMLWAHIYLDFQAGYSSYRDSILAVISVICPEMYVRELVDLIPGRLLRLGYLSDGIDVDLSRGKGTCLHAPAYGNIMTDYIVVGYKSSKWTPVYSYETQLNHPISAMSMQNFSTLSPRSKIEINTESRHRLWSAGDVVRYLGYAGIKLRD